MTKENLQLPYPPSWFDRFKAWVEHLPMPVWLFYLIASLIYYPMITLVQWNAGTYPVGSLSIFHLWLSVEIGLHFGDDAPSRSRRRRCVDEYAIGFAS